MACFLPLGAHFYRTGSGVAHLCRRARMPEVGRKHGGGLDLVVVQRIIEPKHAR